MDPESKKLLEETHNLVLENNKMLHSMRRSARIAHIMTFLYWTFIIGSAIGVYYYLQPYLDQLMGIYGGAKSNLDNVSKIIDGFKNNVPN